MKFQIVGLVPVSSRPNQSNNILDMIQSLGGVSIATPIVSQSYYDSHVDEISRVYNGPDASINYLGLDTQYIVEFNDAETARNFIENESCEMKGALNYGCATEEHRFLLSSNNNNSLISSITSDRKEIAIFRAIGFQRKHILQVYLMYTLILAMTIVGGGVILSLVVGWASNLWLSGVLTDFLRATFSTLDSSIVANLFIPHVAEYFYFGGAVIIVSLLSALLPALIKSRQNIIDGLKFE